MTQLFAYETNDAQGYLFAPHPPAPSPSDDDTKRRPGETALDYRIRRQYRDVRATPPLFPTSAR
jgi:hypothetical protein